MIEGFVIHQCFRIDHRRTVDSRFQQRLAPHRYWLPIALFHQLLLHEQSPDL